MPFLWFCLAGIAAALLFDLLRLIRAFIPHPAAIVWAEDILWSIGCFLAAFICVIRYAGGVVRWFYLAGFFAAMLLWFTAVSPWLLRVLKTFLRGFFKLIGKLCSPFVWIWQKAAMKRPFSRLFEKLFSKNLQKPIAKAESDIV